MEKTFKVKGMHCPSCETILKEDLEDLKVKVLDISHKTGVIKVVFDPKSVNDSKIKSVIENEGYEVVN